MNNFNAVARFYDALAKLVFGKDWQRVQLSPVSKLKPQAKVLIVGGGTGSLLEGLAPTHQVTFVELSASMSARAQKRNTTASIEFILADYLKWRPAALFDVIIFPFFLDSFSPSNLKFVVEKVKTELDMGGELHVVDFTEGNACQRVMIKMMHWFFRLIAGLESDKLQDFDTLLQSNGFARQSRSWFLNRWVFHNIYKFR